MNASTSIISSSSSKEIIVGNKRSSDNDNDNQQPPIKEKKAKTIACDRCRRRKVKCHGNGYTKAPCQYCVSVKLECTYGTKIIRKSSSNSVTKSIGSNNKWSSRISPTSPISAASTSNKVVRGRRSSPRPKKSPSSSPINNNDVAVPLLPGKNIPNSNFSGNKRSIKVVCQILPFTEVLKNDLEYSIKLLSSVILQNESDVRLQLDAHINIPIDEFAESNTTTSQNILAHYDSTTLLSNRELINNLVDLYFTNFHPMLPVLHKSFFYETFNDKNKSISPLLLSAICSIGSRYSNNDGFTTTTAKKQSGKFNTIGLDFYKNAQNMINQYLDVSRLSTATAIFLMGAFDASRNLRSRIYLGMATTFSITMKLHDKNALTFNNTMLGLDDKHSSIEYPNPSIENNEKESRIIEYFVNYVKITKILYEILEFSLSEEKDIDWKKNLPNYLQIRIIKQPIMITKEITIEYLEVYLCIVFNYAIIRLHHTNIYSTDSLLKCIDAANEIIELVNNNRNVISMMMNCEQFISHCIFYSGLINLFVTKKNNDDQQAIEARNNVKKVIEIFTSFLEIPSLNYLYSNIIITISLFATQISDTQKINEIKFFINNNYNNNNNNNSFVYNYNNSNSNSNNIDSQPHQQKSIVKLQQYSNSTNSNLPWIQQQQQQSPTSTIENSNVAKLETIDSKNKNNNNNNNNNGSSSSVTNNSNLMQGMNFSTSTSAQHQQSPQNNSNRQRQKSRSSSKNNNLSYPTTPTSNNTSPPTITTASATAANKSNSSSSNPTTSPNLGSGTSSISSITNLTSINSSNSSNNNNNNNNNNSIGALMGSHNEIPISNINNLTGIGQQHHYNSNNNHNNNNNKYSFFE
nr:6413_t:CDS:2 [Entrophospora candida]